MKTGIFLSGHISGGTIVTPTATTNTIIMGADWSMVREFLFTGAIGPGGTAIYFTGATGQGFLVRDCAFNNNETNVKICGITGPTVIVVDRCITSGHVTYGHACINENYMPTQMCIVNNVYQDLVEPVCSYYALASGINTQINCMNSLLNIIPTSSANGFLVSNGGNLMMAGVAMRGFGNSIHVTSEGAAPTLNASDTLISGSLFYDLLIEHSGTNGIFQGSLDYDKTLIPLSAPFTIYQKDQTIINVSIKGSDFSSIADAINSITNSGVSVRYLIKVGPGIFLENPIYMKSYVSIEGSGIATRISPTSSTQNLIIGAPLSNISNCVLSGVGSGFSAVYYDGTGTQYLSDTFNVNNITLGSNDTLVTINAVTTANISINNCICGGINSFNYGFKCLSTSSGVANVLLSNIYTHDAKNLPLYFAECSGNVTLTMSSIQSIYSTTRTGSCFANAYNGANLMMNDITISNWDIGILSTDSGNAPNINGSSIIASCITNALDIQHPGTTGSLSANVDINKVFVSSPSFFYDLDGQSGTSFNNSFIFNNVNVSKLITEVPSMGLISGGNLSISPITTNGPLLQVTSGYGYSNPNNSLSFFTWSPSTISVTTTLSYVFIDSSDGDVTLSAEYPDTTENILLGSVVADNSSNTYVENVPMLTSHYDNSLNLFLRNAIGPVFSNGCLISYTTSNTLDITQGQYYYNNIEINISAMTGISWNAYYQSSTPGIFISTFQSVIDFANYDNGSGTLTSLASSNYTKHLLIMLGTGTEIGAQFVVIYGQFESSDSNTAINHALPLLPEFYSELLGPYCIYSSSTRNWYYKHRR